MPKRRTDAISKRARQTARGATDVAAQTAKGATVVRPASLEGRAAEIWDEHAPELMMLGMLTARDSLMFGLWCSLGAKVEDGSLTPALATQFRLIGNDFGMSPSGKGRELGAAPATPAKHKFFKD